MSVGSGVFNEACRRMRRGSPPPTVVRFVAAEGGTMLDASRILTHCGLSLTQAKNAIDESDVWPNRASEEAALLDQLAEWDPGEQADLVERLVEAVPELRGAYDEHLADYDELLAHVFFGDVTRFVVRGFASERRAARRSAHRVLEILEHAAATGGPSVLNLVSVSFLENLDPDDPAYEPIRSAMGPALRDELRSYESELDGQL